MPVWVYFFLIECYFWWNWSPFLQLEQNNRELNSLNHIKMSRICVEFDNRLQGFAHLPTNMPLCLTTINEFHLSSFNNSLHVSWSQTNAFFYYSNWPTFVSYIKLYKECLFLFLLIHLQALILMKSVEQKTYTDLFFKIDGYEKLFLKVKSHSRVTL